MSPEPCINTVYKFYLPPDPFTNMKDFLRLMAWAAKNIRGTFSWCMYDLGNQPRIEGSVERCISGEPVYSYVHVDVKEGVYESAIMEAITLAIDKVLQEIGESG